MLLSHFKNSIEKHVASQIVHTQTNRLTPHSARYSSFPGGNGPYSESRQDEFVRHMMNGKVGTYLEIGAWHPIDTNNTYRLEQDGWTGTSIEIDPQWKNPWKHYRKNPLIIADATTYGYEELDHIDYLQLDVEPASQTFATLEKLFKLKTTYSVITYETDAYGDPAYKRTGDTSRAAYVQPSRDLILSKGYILAVPDVRCKGGRGGPFEDWYINPKFVDAELIKTWIK